MTPCILEAASAPLRCPAHCLTVTRRPWALALKPLRQHDSFRDLSTAASVTVEETTTTVSGEIPEDVSTTKARPRPRRARPNPNKAIEASLRNPRTPWAIPDPRPGRLDLAYARPNTLTRQERAKALGKQAQLGHYDGDFASTPTLQLLLAQYIRDSASTDDVDGNGTTRVTQVLPEAKVQFLHSKGFSIADLHDWHTILTNNDSIKASERLLKHSSPQPTDVGSRVNELPVPTFVLTTLLRRTSFAPQALRNVLVYLWNQKSRSPGPSEPSSGLSLDASTEFIILVRLIRLARQVLPEALVSIVRFYIRSWSLPEKWTLKDAHRQRNSVQRIVAQHNKVLHLLAFPCAIDPFASTSIQQTAQFELLGHMSRQHPPIPINREGYRAISRVQLASGKSEQERDWDSLKVNTWPPWKEDKMGFDSEKTPAYGVSRALAAIHHAREAGYASGGWERVASVLSGWDTDHTPTIQTRSWLLHKDVKHNRRGVTNTSKRSLWAARISATRTAQEAWARFLSYKDQGGKVDQSVHFAMLQKLAYEDRRLQQNKDSSEDGLAAQSGKLPQGGDGREVLPIPTSEREGVYIHTAIPSMDEFAQQTMREGLKPTAKMLAFMIAHASSVEDAVKYLRWGGQSDPVVLCLLQGTRASGEDIQRVPLSVFMSFLDLFGRFGESLNSIHDGKDRSSRTVVNVGSGNPVAHMLWLCRKRASTYAPLWHTLLRALAERDMRNHDTERFRLMRLVRREMKDSYMHVDHETFQLLCRGAEGAAVSARILERQHGTDDFVSFAYPRQSTGWGTHTSAAELMASSSSFIRTLFYDLFGTSDPRKAGSKHSTAAKNTGLPRLLGRPNGVTLSSYIRAQGVMQRYHQLLECSRWMSEHKEEIDSAAERTRNGRTILRRALIALRVFCERSWLETDRNELAPSAAPKATIEKIKAIIEGAEGWGGWPTEHEIDIYCAGRLPSRLRRLEIG